MRIGSTLITALLVLASPLYARDYNVSVNGSDANDGSAERPFRTITKASQVAMPGDNILVHPGIYREHIKPPRGGESNNRRISYISVQRHKAEIKGSEVIKNWEKLEGQAWKAVIPNSLFGDYNPYKDLIMGEWYHSQGQVLHTGEVYLNDEALYEVNNLDMVIDPSKYKHPMSFESSAPFARGRKFDGPYKTWFCVSDENNTTIYANFGDKDPNAETVEINVRKSCFYPDRIGVDYIRIDGFVMSHAATQWAPPTVEQVGLIGTNWSKGWIIENNIIKHSRCSGITLGKGSNTNVGGENRDGFFRYNEVIAKAILNGWNKESTGGHIVRNNTIRNCEQTAICGSLNSAFCQIYNNDIYDIWVKRQYGGAEMAGIKFHGAIDTIIKDNRISNCSYGLWLDWSNQGTRVTGNLLFNNDDDVLLECDHGPIILDNNLFLSNVSLLLMSNSGLFAHNLILGGTRPTGDLPAGGRYTPYHYPHSTAIKGIQCHPGGFDRIFNNIYSAKDPKKRETVHGDQNQFGTKSYDMMKTRVGNDIVIRTDTIMGGNVYFNGVEASSLEKDAALFPNFNPEVKVMEEKDGIYLQFKNMNGLGSVKTKFVRGRELGQAGVSLEDFENPDGTELVIDRDYFGRPRDPEKPMVGPFEQPSARRIKVWPKNQNPPRREKK